MTSRYRQGIDYDTGGSERLYSHADICPGKPDCIHDEEASMDETKHTPWTISKPGFGKVAATIPIIYNTRGNAVAHVLGGQDKAIAIVQAVNSYASNQAQIAALREALNKLANEAQAILVFREDIRERVGNTNVAVLELRIDEARAALGKQEFHK